MKQTMIDLHSDLDSALALIATLIGERDAAITRAERLQAALLSYPEWTEDVDETAYPTGDMTCLLCGGGGHTDGRKRAQLEHKPDCLRVIALRPIIAV